MDPLMLVLAASVIVNLILSHLLFRTGKSALELHQMILNLLEDSRLMRIARDDVQAGRIQSQTASRLREDWQKLKDLRTVQKERDAARTQKTSSEKPKGRVLGPHDAQPELQN